MTNNRDKIERVAKAIALSDYRFDEGLQWPGSFCAQEVEDYRVNAKAAIEAASIEPPADLAGLCERLRATVTRMPVVNGVFVREEAQEAPINPDGPAAADAIEALSALQQGER